MHNQILVPFLDVFRLGATFKIINLQTMLTGKHYVVKDTSEAGSEPPKTQICM